MKSAHILTVLFITILLNFSVYAGKRVLHISSYNMDYSWSKNCTEGIESVLKKNYVLKNLYMNTKEIPESMFRKAADSALNKGLKFRPDIVILGDDNALKFLGTIFITKKIPIVYYGINSNPRNYLGGRIPDNVFGLIERPLIIPLYRYIKDMIPHLERILVMFDKSVSSSGVISSAFYGKRTLTVNNCVFDIITVETWKEWESKIKRAYKTYQAVIIANHFTIKSTSGKTLSYKVVMKRSSLLSKIPVFAMNDHAVHSEGAVGAMVIEGRDHGMQAGKIAKSILEGEKKITKHVVQKAGKVIFNKVQLKRYKLKLPEELAGNVIFR